MTALLSKEGLFTFLTNVFEGNEEKETCTRPFLPPKSLLEKDQVLIDMLNSQGHENVCFCICDPELKDMPIIFASEGFCNFTGYSSQEIEGQNCRFLQGPRTDEKDVERIRQAIKTEAEANVNLLNYRKDGSEFVNQFFLAPLHSKEDAKKVLYYIGVQCNVDQQGPGQMPSNPGM